MKPMVLLVDDNEEILEFLEHELAEKYEVVKATNGFEALEKLQENAVHLIISDIMMPEMDGFELCRRLKSDFEHSHIPVILLTARNTLQSKIEGLEIGADAYIDKPFSVEFLLAQVASLLNNRNKIKEYFASSPLVHLKSMAYSKADEMFLENIHNTILENLEDPGFDVDKLARLLAMSKPTLYRKIKSLADLSPNEIINITRLKKAAELLLTGNYKIYEVAYMVGFGTQTNFGRSFLKQFGMTPSDYLSKKDSGKNK